MDSAEQDAAFGVALIENGAAVVLEDFEKRYWMQR